MARLVPRSSRQVDPPCQAECAHRRDGRIATSLGLALLAAVVACQESTDPPLAPELDRAGPVAAVNAPPFRQVSAGQGHTCGTTTADVAYCWGSGALGAGSQAFSTTPVLVVGGHAFREVSAGRFHSCGVTTADVAYCWGGNNTGQLGDGTETDRRRPVRVVGGLDFRQVSAGALHTCGVTTGNVAYCWGHNQAGGIGNGTTNGSHEPVRVARDLAFRRVSAGDQFACGVTTDDVGYCWGMNTLGQLGIGTDAGPETCFTGDSFDACSTTPVRVVGNLDFNQVNAGYNHTCGVTTNDAAFCWGDNSVGQLGRRTSTGPELCLDVVPCSTRPTRVAGGLAFAAVDGGASHTCGVATDGVGYCWGSNESGELGIGSKSGPETCSGIPCSTKPVPLAGGHVFRSTSADLRSSCAVTTGNVAFCWGENFSGQLGNGTTQRRLRPRRVVGSS